MSEQSADARTSTPYDLLSPAFHQDPHSVFHQMRNNDPVYFHPLLNLWVLTRYDDVQMMMRDPRFSAERPGQLGMGASEAMKPKVEAFAAFCSRWMILRDPPRHTVLRALLTKAFTPQVIERLRPVVTELVDEMLGVVVHSGSMDIVRDLAFPLPAIVIGRMLGVPRQHIDAFKGWTNELFVLLGAGVATDEKVEAGYRGVVGLETYFRGLIAERRENPGDDLISGLLAAEEEGTFLSEDELISMCALLLVAGHETTTHLIGNATLALLRNPAELQKLRDNPELIDNAVEELLRYDGAAFMLSRRATEDLEIGGQKIRANDILIGFAHAANRDPAVFPSPDRLDITRTGAKSVAFGYGIHYCIGAALARLEAKIAISAIATRLPELRLASESLEYIPNLAIHGLAALPVTFRAAQDDQPDSRGPASWQGPASLRSPLSSRAPVSVPFHPTV